MGKAKQEITEEEGIADVMAWGSYKDNYYKNSEDEYSSLEEEEQEALKIYENQFKILNDQEIYELPQEASKEGSGSEDSEDGLSFEYLIGQIKWAVKLGCQLVGDDSVEQCAMYRLINSYLLVMIALKELQIPYIKHHPILQTSFKLKHHIQALKEKIGVKSESTQALNHDAKTSDSLNKLGLCYYQSLQAKRANDKKQRKERRRLEIISSKEPAFLQVKEHEGRLASQKILKNKGLIKKRKKIQSNSRVKLRMKYEKKLSLRRARGHVIRQNPGRNYEGQKNIKLGLIKSTKLK